MDINDKLPVLMTQEDYCIEKFNVTPEFFRQIAEAVASGDSGTRFTRNKRRLHRYLTKHLAKVAKTELDFSDDSSQDISIKHDTHAACNAANSTASHLANT